MKEVPQEFADDPGASAYFEASLYANLKAEEQLEIAKAMKAECLPVSIIAKCTGLTEDQIKQL